MSRVLAKLGLHRNPYVDRTAEKTNLLDGSFYLHSDLQGFSPSATTYLFFGRRGSGKTTIRLMMHQRHNEYNAERVARGEPELLVVDLCQPGRVGDCLKSFMTNINANVENWDARFCEEWRCDDLADMIVSFAVDDLVRSVVDMTPQGKRMVERLVQRPRLASQFLLLSHLYGREDSATLARIRHLIAPRVGMGQWLVKHGAPPTIRAALVATGAFGVAGYFGLVPSSWLPAGLFSASSTTALTTPPGSGNGGLSWHSPMVLASTVLAGAVLGLFRWLGGRGSATASARAATLCAPVRIAETRQDVVEGLLDKLVSVEDDADLIRRLFLGSNAQQKLELLNSLALGCGYEGVAVFGDCFDEVGLLDPLNFPGGLKVFAREVCRNEILNIGHLHFFFPDSRASLDLSTDRTVREARFDRHFVRDLTWSRFQLEDLAQRRFAAAQEEGRLGGGEGGVPSNGNVEFQSLFEHVSREDFSAAIAKLHTPRELMVFMTELMGRIEAHAAGDGAIVAAQDMEIAVKAAKEQSV